MLVSVQSCSCLAAAVVLIWDWFDTLTTEVQSIWKLPLNQQRLTYLISRYIGIGFQLANFIYTVTSGIGGSDFKPVPHHVCRNWLIMQMGSFLALYAIGSANLMMQAYVLHRGSIKVLVLLPLLVIAEYTSAVVGIKRRLDTIAFDDKCNRLNTYRGPLVLIAIITLNQCVTWSLILEKVILGGATIPIRKILFSGGQWTWFLGAGLLAITIPMVSDGQYTVVSWPTSLVSVGTCRLILTSEKLRWSRQQDRLAHSQRHSSRSQGTITHLNSNPWRTTGAPSVDIRSGSQSSADDNDQPTSINSFYSSGHDMEDNNSSITSGNLPDDQWGMDEAIEVGSQHTSSSLNSEEIREHWNDLYNPSPLRRL